MSRDFVPGVGARARVGKGVHVLVRAPGHRADSTAAVVRCGRRGQFARPHAHLAYGACERRRRPQKGQSRRQWEGLSLTRVLHTVPEAVWGRRGGGGREVSALWQRERSITASLIQSRGGLLGFTSNAHPARRVRERRRQSCEGKSVNHLALYTRDALAPSW